jgi:meso-butanediol dehydrogenase / (S,S)-butanediol dehydrogenase / diacetyl reductase
VTDRTSVREAIDACRQKFGSIKVMVNNAGFNKPEPFLEASEAVWHKIMDVNALGVMIGIQEAAKAKIAAGTKGKIINTASIAVSRRCACMFNLASWTRLIPVSRAAL